MKKFLFSTAVALTTCLVCGLGLTSCSEDAGDSPASVSTRTTEELPDVILTNKTLFANVTYVLTGKTYVPNGVTLTINAGTRIEGVFNALPTDASALVVTKGGKIMANGTAAAPIIMTAQNGTKGGWGGLVLLGKATVNQGNNGVIEGIDPTNTTIPAGISVTYGGSDDADNSGVLSYVRVEYAGAAIAEANELNAFTFGGVGSGTIVDHCQAYQGADDAFEFFGGTVNCKYLVATANDDDSFDFDFGYRGKIQFAVSTIDPSLSYSKDPNGIECDNEGTSPYASTPFTHPVLSNLTIVGTSNGKVFKTGATDGVSLKSAANFRRNCKFTLVNSVLYGFPKGILKETTNTYTLENNVVCAVPGTGVNFSVFTPSATNSGLTSYSDIVLTSPFGDYYNSNALRPTGGAAINGSYYQHTDSFFVQTEYKGAIEKGRVNSWLQENWIK